MSNDRSSLGTTKKRRGSSPAVWVSLVLAVLILVALLVFVAQNSQRVALHYLSANTTIGFGVAMLLSAVAGVLITVLVGIVLKIRRALH